MQQRFSSAEIRKQGNHIQEVSIAEMLNHPWITGSKKDLSSSLKLTIKELLNVSSDWKDINQKNVAADFQAQ
jgi:hypothetical protein